MQPRTENQTIIKRLSAVLAESGRSGTDCRAYFYREHQLREHVRTRDHVLYTAHRNIAPARPAVAFDGDWRVDRVRYPGVDLPSGELNRSTGHWNPDDQWEIFDIERGEVILVVRRPDPTRPTELIRCRTGSLVVLEPGCWHLTYVPREPAVVSNAYLATAAPSAGRKYFTRPTVRCGLRRPAGDSSGVAVFRDERDTGQPPAPPTWHTAEPRERAVPGLPPLATLFRADHDRRALSEFEEHCVRATHGR